MTLRSFALPLVILLGACGVDHSSPVDTGSADQSQYTWGEPGTGSSGSGDTEDTEDTVDTDTEDTDSDTADTDTACTETVWYLDSDEDEFGLTASSTWSCTQPDGYVAVGGDLNDTDPNTHNVVRICATGSNGKAFSVAVIDIDNGNSAHWFASDGTVPSPLFVSTSDTDWCEEFPEAASTDTLKISGLGTTTYGYGDFLVYSCGGDDADSIYYDGDTDCAVVTFAVNGYPVTTFAADSDDYQWQ